MLKKLLAFFTLLGEAIAEAGKYNFDDPFYNRGM